MQASPEQFDASTIRAGHLRPLLRQIDLCWIDGAESEEVRARVGKRLIAGTEVLMGIFDRMSYGSWEIEDPIRKIGRSIKRSRRVITRYMWALEKFGLIERIPMGPAPWITRLCVPRVMELAKAHGLRAVEEDRKESLARAARWRERCERNEARYKERRESAGTAPASTLTTAEPESLTGPASAQSTIISPAETGPPPRRFTPPSMPTTRPERRRGEHPTSPALATALWNLVPWHPAGAQEAHDQTVWGRDVLASSPVDAWLDMSAYVDLCGRGSSHYWPNAASIHQFQRCLFEVRQWRLAQGHMPEPWLGRGRRQQPVAELPPPPPWEDVRARRAGVLAPWLRELTWELCACHEDLVTYVADVLGQAQGPPWPDWLPEVLRPAWGRLPLLDPS